MIDLLLRKSRNVTLLFATKKYELLNLAVLLKNGHLWDMRTTVLKSSHLREIRIHSIKLSFCGSYSLIILYARYKEVKLSS